MSRIHEALKKAEEQRAAIQGRRPPADAGEAAIPAGSDNGNSGAAVLTLASPAPAEGTLASVAEVEWNPDPKTMLFLSGDENAEGTEEFRTLRSRLYHLREKKALKTLLVTSALPQEGKSFTSANLAQVLAMQQGRRVLLIDADLRGPQLHRMLGTKAAPGLSDYLAGKLDEFSVMQKGLLANLFFLPSGSEVHNPAELVGNGQLKALVEGVGALFDWIVIDSPPAVPVSDASVLATACDGVLLVVRSATTPADAAQRAREEFPDEMLLGVVLNGAENAAPYHRYYNEGNQRTTTKG